MKPAPERGAAPGRPAPPRPRAGRSGGRRPRPAGDRRRRRLPPAPEEVGLGGDLGAKGLHQAGQHLLRHEKRRWNGRGLGLDGLDEIGLGLRAIGRDRRAGPVERTIGIVSNSTVSAASLRAARSEGLSSAAGGVQARSAGKAASRVGPTACRRAAKAWSAASRAPSGSGRRRGSGYPLRSRRRGRHRASAPRHGGARWGMGQVEPAGLDLGHRLELGGWGWPAGKRTRTQVAAGTRSAGWPQERHEAQPRCGRGRGQRTAARTRSWALACERSTVSAGAAA